MIPDLSNYKSIWFDLDNTILNFNANSKIAFSKLLEEVNIFEESHYYSLYKAINKHVWWEMETNRISQETVRRKRFELFFNVLSLDIDGLMANEIYFKFLVQDPIFVQNAHSLLQKLKDSHELLIVTNGMKEVQNQRLDNSGIRSYFKSIVISDEIGTAKPAASFFEYAYVQSSIKEKSKILVIGDSLNTDVIGANKFGIDSCWFNHEEVVNTSDIKPDYEILSIAQLFE